jgi:hypothetical protein
MEIKNITDKKGTNQHRRSEKLERQRLTGSEAEVEMYRSRATGRK